MNGRMPNNQRTNNYRQYQTMPIPRSPTHNIINISSSDDDSQAMQPMNLSRKRIIRDAATVVR